MESRCKSPRAALAVETQQIKDRIAIATADFAAKTRMRELPFEATSPPGSLSEKPGFIVIAIVTWLAPVSGSPGTGIAIATADFAAKTRMRELPFKATSPPGSLSEKPGFIVIAIVTWLAPVSGSPD